MSAPTPKPPVAHYTKEPWPVPTTITRPGKRRSSPPIVTQGRILGTMYSRGQLHHYPVEGDDGVLYLCPPSWLPDDPLSASRVAHRAALRCAIVELTRQWSELPA